MLLIVDLFSLICEEYGLLKLWAKLRNTCGIGLRGASFDPGTSYKDRTET